MTIYIGPAGAPLESISTEGGIRKCAELGLNLMEVEFVQGVRMTEATGEKVGAVARECGVRLSCHGPYYVNFNAVEPEKIVRSMGHILSAAKVAHAMGAYIVVFHAGFYLGMEKDAVQKKIRAGLGECLTQMEKNGWDDVALGLETTGKHSQWGTVEEISKLCREFRNIALVIDFAHLYARGNGSLKTEAHFEALMGDFEKLKPKFLHSHFSCIKYSDKGEIKHLSMGESAEPDFRTLAPVLKKRNYDISIVCESPMLDKDALKMQGILKRA